MSKILLALDVPEKAGAVTVQVTAENENEVRIIDRDLRSDDIQIRERAYKVLSEYSGVSKKILEILEEL